MSFFRQRMASLKGSKVHADGNTHRNTKSQESERWHQCSITRTHACTTLCRKNERAIIRLP
ncbi:hypothetical protein BDR03DRAFT_964001 [Suillus americanus]|nr:hypothetical protein BDR03DRAFT_964001 [Suillus americanus]